MPRYIAESMNNTKDLPFAVLMLVGLYYILTIKPRISVRVVEPCAQAGRDDRCWRSMCGRWASVLFGYAGIGLAIAVDGIG